MFHLPLGLIYTLICRSVNAIRITAVSLKIYICTLRHVSRVGVEPRGASRGPSLMDESGSSCVGAERGGSAPWHPSAQPPPFILHPIQTFKNATQISLLFPFDINLYRGYKASIESPDIISMRLNNFGKKGQNQSCGVGAGRNFLLEESESGKMYPLRHRLRNFSLFVFNRKCFKFWH